MDNFSFFLISRAQGLSGINGILGLSPADQDNGPSFMKALYKQGQISEYKVSFQLNYWANTTTFDNYADFGVPVSSRARGDTWHTRLNKKNDQWWTLHLHSFKYNSDDLMTGLMKYAIVDTGTSLLYLIPNDFINFMMAVKAASSSIECDSYYCYSNTDTCAQLAPKLSDFNIHLGQV